MYVIITHKQKFSTITKQNERGNILMKKYCAVFFTFALLFMAVIIAGGCGGSSGGDVALDTPQEQNQSNENQNQNQEQEQQNQNQNQEQNQQVDNTPSNPQTGTISANSLNGTWTGSGSGTGFNSRVTGPVAINTEVRYTISNVSETSGTADIQIYDRTTNSQYGIDTVRDWQHSSQFSMTNSGANSWTFSREYSDGADIIILTLNSASSGTLRVNGGMWNEDNPSDYTTYDVTCNVTKQ